MPSFRAGVAAWLRFVLVFGLFIAPWPRANEVIPRFFRAELRAIAHHAVPRMVVHITPLSDPAHEGIDTQVEMADRREMLPDGSVPVRGVTLDTRSIGWIPHAMIAALVVATPMRWQERAKAMLLGLVATHFLVALSFAITLTFANNSRNAGWIQPIMAVAYDITNQNLWFSFLFPAILWWLICFEVKGRASSAS